MDFASHARHRIRSILDGGPGAITALLGDQMGNLGVQDLPWVNFIHSGITALAQKLGQVPEARVSPPHDTDNEAPRKRAEKRERIVTAYDEYDRLELQLPQVGRWLPGYGFSVWTISTQMSSDGYVYPCAQLRDPYDAYPGEWGVRQQPEELAICRRISPVEAERRYPKYASQIATVSRGRDRVGGGILLSSSSGWENQTGRGLELVEYYDKDGTHILLPKIEARVDFHPNPISTPAFVVAKRYAFNNLIGQYDHAIGPMGAHAKLSILYLTSMQDNVFAPTDIAGDMDGQYKRGRYAVNKLAPGTNVSRPVSNIPYQAFEGLNRIERDIRNIIRYPIQDDGNSPLNFATGAGLEELQAGMSAEVTEYQKVIRYALQDLDTKRLEWDERVSPDTRKPLAGMRLGVPHTESYTPSKDIKGAYRTMREFGFMSGLDEPGKLVAGGQAMTMGLIDSLSLQEKISGLDDIPRINERKIHDQMRAVLQQGLLAAASQNDPKAMMVAVDSLPEGAEKALYQKWLTPDGDEMSPEEEEMAGAGAPPPSGDITTVLSQLTGSGARSGLQTVSRV
jgi:hypothetical protein